MEISDIIAIVSVTAELLSVIWASISHRTAKKALKIAKRERDVKESNIDIYLSEIFSTINKEENKFIISSLIITNKSEVSDSITRIELIIDYLVSDTLTNVVIGAKKQNLDLKTISNIKITAPPFLVGPRGSISVWVCFEIPQRVKESKRINSYKIEVLSASGAEEFVEPKMIGGLFDE